MISVPRPLVAVKEFSIRGPLGWPPNVCVPLPPNSTVFISRYQEMSASFSTSHRNHEGIVNIMQSSRDPPTFYITLSMFTFVELIKIDPLSWFSSLQGWLIFLVDLFFPRE